MLIVLVSSFYSFGVAAWLLCLPRVFVGLRSGFEFAFEFMDLIVIVVILSGLCFVVGWVL